MPSEYIRTYKKLFSSHFLYEGIRITIGVVTPVIVAAYFGHIVIGVTMALGALATSIVDSPGPIHHRRNAMLVTMLLLFIVSFVAGIAVHSHMMVIFLLLVCSFLFSMIGVYGARPTNIGTAGLLILILSLDKKLNLQTSFFNALWIAAGGFFYFLLSQVSHTLRPYKLLQQVLGDCMGETANYFRFKAQFYGDQPDFDTAINELPELQSKVHAKQQVVREILFKTRDVVQESTFIGRVLLMSFVDTVDLFERIAATPQDYRLLHDQLGRTDILGEFKETILVLADDLENLSVSFQEGRGSKPDPNSEEMVIKLDAKFIKVRDAFRNAENLEAFISLRQILESIKDLHSRIDTLHLYSTYDKKVLATHERNVDYKRFVDPSDFSLELFRGNLNFKSNIFRHSIRLCIAMLLGYLLSLFFTIDHSYWILLTISVILKPGYALTFKRNVERLGGTLIGGSIGAIILLLTQDNHILVAIIIICMIVAYASMRTKYFLFVIFVTIYVLLAIHFLRPGEFAPLLKSRVLDTGLGSIISLSLLFLIPPVWEVEKILELCAHTIKANADYFNFMASFFSGKPVAAQEYRVIRKNIFVSLANLSDAFQRMLNEPKRKQQQGEYIHQIVVANNVLASNIASLSVYRNYLTKGFSSPLYQPIIDNTLDILNEAADTLENKIIQQNAIPATQQKFLFREAVDRLMEKRMEELSQGKLETVTRGKLSGLKTIVDQFESITRISGDINKICRKLVVANKSEEDKDV